MSITKFNNTDQNIIELEDVSIVRDSNTVIRDASCCIPRNQLTFIVGENGSGKTSMVSSILGLLEISSGRITYNSSTDKELVIGYVPQKIEFPEHFQLTVAEYLKYSAHISKHDLLTALERVDFPESHLKQRITELSGGQMQKLLLAAELARNPDILFLDEPLSNIDQGSGKHIIDVIMEIKDQGVTIVLISHDWQLVSSCADCVICLSCTSSPNCPCKNSLSEGNREVLQITSHNEHVTHEGYCYVQNL